MLSGVYVSFVAWGLGQPPALTPQPQTSTPKSQTTKTLHPERPYLTHSVSKAVFEKSIPAQIRVLILCASNSEGKVDEFMGELTCAKRL